MALTSTHHGFFRGIARYARQHGWHLDTQMAYSGRIPFGWQGDGIISACGHHRELAQFVRSCPLPRVELTLVQDDLDVPRVVGNNPAIGRTAAEYFLQRRFRHFAWAPFADDVPNRQRLAGFESVVRAQGRPVQTLPTGMTVTSRRPRFDWRQARARLIRALQGLPKPLAVFAYNDGIGVEIIDACQEAGLMVPEQVAVLGVDNDEIVCESVSVALSSIRYDLEQLAYEGAALLDGLMAGRPAPAEMLKIDPQGIVTRRSTDILAMDDVEVAKALRFIWANYADPLLSVPGVVAITRFSARGLLKAFQRELGRSIHAEIVRMRMNQVCELLRNTDLTVSTIAERAGFSSVNHLFRAFRRIHRQSPGQYRRQSRRHGPDAPPPDTAGRRHARR